MRRAAGGELSFASRRFTLYPPRWNWYHSDPGKMKCFGLSPHAWDCLLHPFEENLSSEEIFAGNALREGNSAAFSHLTHLSRTQSQDTRKKLRMSSFLIDEWTKAILTYLFITRIAEAKSNIRSWKGIVKRNWVIKCLAHN